MSTIHKEESSQIMADCQAKLIEIDRKLLQIKSRCRPRKTKHKYSLNTHEDFIILKKETESLESDLQFVKSLLDETTEVDSSFPLKMMKKLLPLRIFPSQNKPVSNEIKAKIIAHSTALLEEKVKVLQTMSNSKKKRRRPKPESRDSMATETTNSIKQQKFYKAGASSDSEIIMSPEKIPSLKVLSSLKKQNDYARALKRKMFTGTRDLQVWNPEFGTFFITKNSKSESSLKKNRSNGNDISVTLIEKYAQTSEMNSSKPITAEKFVQTDFPLVTWVGSTSKDKKSSTKLEEKGTNTEMFEEDELPKPVNRASSTIRLIQEAEHTETLPTLPGNILDINEIENIINSLLSSPLKMLQCKHINKLTGGNTSNPPGFVNLIIRQSDFMPVLISGTEHKKETFTQCLTKDNRLFPYVYYVKHTIYPITFTQDETQEKEIAEEGQCNDSSLDICPSMNYKNKVGKTEYSVEYKIADTNKNPQTTNTLQIDYENPLASGRIVLTEFRSSQPSSQSEMLSRILAHLIGLPNTQEKNNRANSS